jgi:hypothetical protein
MRLPGCEWQKEKLLLEFGNWPLRFIESFVAWKRLWTAYEEVKPKIRLSPIIIVLFNFLFLFCH